MLYAVFIGWFVTSDIARETLQLEDGPLFATWRFLMRFVVPIGIVAIFVSSLYDALNPA